MVGGGLLTPLPPPTLATGLAPDPSGEAFSASNPKLDLKGLLLRGGEWGGRDIGEGKEGGGGRRRGRGEE